MGTRNWKFKTPQQLFSPFQFLGNILVNFSVYCSCRWHRTPRQRGSSLSSPSSSHSGLLHLNNGSGYSGEITNLIWPFSNICTLIVAGNASTQIGRINKLTLSSLLPTRPPLPTYSPNHNTSLLTASLLNALPPNVLHKRCGGLLVGN